MKKYLTSFVVGVALLSATNVYAETDFAHKIITVSKQSHPCKTVNISSLKDWTSPCIYDNIDDCDYGCYQKSVEKGYIYSECFPCEHLKYYCRLSN